MAMRSFLVSSAVSGYALTSFLAFPSLVSGEISDSTVKVCFNNESKNNKMYSLRHLPLACAMPILCMGGIVGIWTTNAIRNCYQ
jgi:hypothetical protein